MVWQVEPQTLEYKIYYNGQVIATFSHPITAADVISSARENGLRKIDVVNYNTRESLTQSDFPVTFDIEIIPVNEAA